MEKYQAHAIEKVKAEGKSQAAIDKQLADMKKFAELYKNPFINSAVTFLEPLPGWTHHDARVGGNLEPKAPRKRVDDIRPQRRRIVGAVFR